MEFTKETSYSAFTTYRVQLPAGGEARITPTDANHIHFDANHHSANGRPGDRCWIVCRGIEYGASIHLQRVNGEWLVIDRPYVQRASKFTDASPAAVKWIVSAALDVVQEFARQHGLVLAQAQTAQVARDIEKQQAELIAARARVAELEKLGGELAREFQLCITLELRADKCATCGGTYEAHHSGISHPFARTQAPVSLVYDCAVCGKSGAEHGHYDAHDPNTHKFVCGTARAVIK